MTRRQLDLYPECNGGQAPEDVFTEACCSRCVNPDCSRSLYGKGGFEDRVRNWHERLFSQVPRLPDDDPRYGKIAGQRFLLIDPEGSTPASSAWVDPRDLEAKSVQITRAIPPTPPAPTPVQITPPEPVAQVAEFKQEAAPAEPAAPSGGALNTPVKGGQMLKGSATQAPPASGGWVTPPPAPTHAVPDAKVVKPGSRIKLGS